jgi:arabinofuranosyltransferase
MSEADTGLRESFQQVPGSDSRRRLVIGAGLLLLAVVFIRTAWLCDDAYITLRTVDNFVNGFGLRWNVAERVQAYTHPAWMFLITPFYALTREPFYTVIVLQIALGLAGAALLLRGLTRSSGDAALAVAALAGSKAYVEFTTAGLENALAHLLLVIFVSQWLRSRASDRGLRWLGVLTSLLLLCRLDFAVLLAPMIVSSLWPISRRRLVSFVIGLTPLFLWELISLVYYGQLVPNTALAKLPPGVPLMDLVSQGVKYLQATFHFDPATIVFLGLAVVALGVAGGRSGRIIAAAVTLHLMYVVAVGGDFMSGRFLTPLFVVAIAGAAGTVSWRLAPSRLLLLAAAMLASAALNPAGPLRTGSNFGTPESPPEMHRDGVVDERRMYYPWLGLLRVMSGAAAPADHPAATSGRLALDRGVAVMGISVIGLAGYYAGPTVHIIDRMGLADPLLARLPPEPDWRPGHFYRNDPAGYLDSCKRRENLIEDPVVRSLYADVLTVTRGPLFGSGRLAAMWRLH